MNGGELARALAPARVVVCAGTGGVGKTTTSAAIALAAARAGEHVAVLTIDPARRLADALGVDLEGGDGDAAHSIAVDGDGSLAVFTLDSRRTFDRLVDRFAPDAATRERILANALYQQIVTTVAGSAEYAALERVYEIAEDARFDRIVVDTPPAQHALEFLEAPMRIAEFLDSRLVALLLQPTLAAGRVGLRLFERAAHSVLALIERVSGLAFLEDLSELLIALESLTEGLRGRAQGLSALLRSDATRFVVVTGPSTEAARAADRFLDQLDALDVRVAGVVANRVRTWPDNSVAPDALARFADGGADDDARRALALRLEPALGERADAGARAAFALASGYAAQVLADRRALEPLAARARSAGRFFHRVPELAADVHDVDGLDAIVAALFGETAARASAAPEGATNEGRATSGRAATEGAGTDGAGIDGAGTGGAKT